MMIMVLSMIMMLMMITMLLLKNLTKRIKHLCLGIRGLCFKQLLQIRGLENLNWRMMIMIIMVKNVINVGDHDSHDDDDEKHGCSPMIMS